MRDRYGHTSTRTTTYLRIANMIVTMITGYYVILVHYYCTYLIARLYELINNIHEISSVDAKNDRQWHNWNGRKAEPDGTTQLAVRPQPALRLLAAA